MKCLISKVIGWKGNTRIPYLEDADSLRFEHEYSTRSKTFHRCLKLMQWRIEIARNLAAIFRTIKLPTLNLKTPPQTRMRSHWKVVLKIRKFLWTDFFVYKNCKQMFFILIQQNFSMLLIFSIQYLFLHIF